LAVELFPLPAVRFTERPGVVLFFDALFDLLRVLVAEEVPVDVFARLVVTCLHPLLLRVASPLVEV